MKGHQVTFFLTPHDLAECEARMRNLGELVLFEYRALIVQPQILDSTVVPEMGKSWLKICLARPRDVLSVRFDEVKEQGHYMMDVIRSPAVELSRCFFDGKHLRRGRLYFVSEFFGSDGVLVRKEHDFVKWAKGVLRFAVKGLARDLALESYVGPHADSLRKDGECTFEA